MKEEVCPDDTVSSSWISRHSIVPQICDAMKHIDGEEFYQKYLLQVKFEGNILGNQSCLPFVEFNVVKITN